MVLIKYATQYDTNNVINFFNKNLIENEQVYSTEFLCSLGIKGAIRRNQILIALKKDKIIGALRYYKRKKENIVSLYQFAIDKEYRGGSWLKNMLNRLNADKVISLCPVNIKFNDYYKKTDWVLEKTDEKYNYWSFQS